MPVYRTKGTLTGYIEADQVARADAYLREHDMTEYLPSQADIPSDVLEHIEWKLEADGHSWNVTAFTTRELDDAELARLAGAVSGQNSDGLGESFEQQPFAEQFDECGECWNCREGYGRCEEESSYSMISFDWETNDCKFERVK